MNILHVIIKKKNFLGFVGLIMLNIGTVQAADSNWRTKAAIALGLAGAASLGVYYWQRWQAQQKRHRPDRLHEALLQTLQSNNVEQARALLQQGAPMYGSSREEQVRAGGIWPINDRHDTGDVFIEACRTGHIPMLQLFLEFGADVNHVSHWGWTPLLAAVAWPDAIRFLLEHGANPETLGHPGNTGNASVYPLIFAARSTAEGSLETMRLLLQYGANPNYATPQAPHGQWRAEETALHAAALNSNHSLAAQKARLLIESGAHVDMREEQQITPLILAATVGNSELVAILLANGAQINAQNEQGQTALMMTIFMQNNFPVIFDNYMTIITMLLDAGADTAIRDRHGNAAIDYAAAPETIEALLGHGSPQQRIRVHAEIGEEGQKSRKAELRANIGATIAKTKDIIVLLADAASTFDEQKKNAATQQYLRIQALSQTLQKNLQESGFDSYQSLFDSLVQEPMPFDVAIFERFTSVLDTIAGLEMPDNALSFTFKKLSDIRDGLNAQLASKRAAQEVTACPICLEEPGVVGELTQACRECKYKTCQPCLERLQNPTRDEIFGRAEPRCPQCAAALQPQQEVQPAAEQPQQGWPQRLQTWWRGLW